MFINTGYRGRKGSAWQGCQETAVEDRNTVDPGLAGLGQTEHKGQDGDEKPPKPTLILAGINIMLS